MQNRFCVHCGAPITNLSPQSPVLTCAACGKSFANPFVAKPTGGGVPGWLLVVLAAPFAIAVIGILAAIAIPNFIRFRQRAQQNACRSTLREIATAQATTFTSTGHYASDLASLSVHAPTKSRYAYFVGPAPDGVRDVDATQASLASEDVPSLADGEVPGVTPDGFVAVCVGQVDADPMLDVWSISNRERLIAGRTAPAGEPWKHADDLMDELTSGAAPPAPSIRRPKR